MLNFWLISGAFSFQGNSTSDNIIQFAVLGLLGMVGLFGFLLPSCLIIINMIIYLHDFCTGHYDMPLDYFCWLYETTHKPLQILNIITLS